MSADYNEEAYENALIELFLNMGWEYVYGPEVDRDWHSPLYDSVLEDSIRRLNPKTAPAAIDEALLKLRHFENAELKKEKKANYKSCRKRTRRPVELCAVWGGSSCRINPFSGVQKLRYR
ncbi:MAG: hypothetical protein IJP61_11040 [Treponema sp.]|nr:hypothetical protein [Treponema sp.]